MTPIRIVATVLTAGLVWYFAVRLGRDLRQNMSWKLGYGRGKAGRPWSEPWWVDRKVYGLAYMQGKGVDLASFSKNITETDR